MPPRVIDLKTWPRAASYRLFRPFEKPHYAITTRLDVTAVMARSKSHGLPVYRACLYAVAAGLDAVPALRQRFDGETVYEHDTTFVSMTVPRTDGTFGLAYVRFVPDFSQFERAAAARIDDVASRDDFEPDIAVDGAIAYLSCLPWIDFTSLDNALPKAEDCIPRVAWGKIVEENGGYRMAMSLQAHHALVDGAHMGQFFETVQTTLTGLATPD